MPHTQVATSRDTLLPAATVSVAHHVTPAANKEVCISDYCVHLGDRAVFIFSDNGTLRKTLPLNPLTCPPRYLHPSTVSENLIFIVCHPTSGRSVTVPGTRRLH